MSDCSTGNQRLATADNTYHTHTLAQLFKLLAFAEVVPFSQSMQAQNVISRDTFVALDSEGTTVILHCKVLPNGSCAISQEWM